MKKVLFVATVVRTHILEFHVPYLEMFHDRGWQVDVAARDDGFDTVPFCDNYFDIKFERNPFSPKNLRAYRKLRKIIRNGDYDIIHCHTPVAGVLTRIAAHFAHSRRVIYTAHGFHFFNGSPKKNWMLYYPVERFLSRWTDDLITIVDEDYELASNRFHARRTWIIPGIGIDIEKFSHEPDKEKTGSSGVKHILSVGELDAVKNHADAIRAVAQIPDVDYSIAGSGVLHDELDAMIKEMGLEDRVHLLGYRNDVPELLKDADLFLFPSLREGLPVALMEAIASKVPAVAYNIRGCRDLLPGECLTEKNNIDGLVRLIRETPDCVQDAYDNLRRYDISEVKKQMDRIYFGDVSYVSAYVRNEDLDPASYYRIKQYAGFNWKINSAVTDRQFRDNLTKGVVYKAFLWIEMSARRMKQLRYDIKHRPSHVIVQRELVPRYLPLCVLNKLKKLSGYSNILWDFDDDIRLFNECSIREFSYLKQNAAHILVTNDYLNNLVDGKAQLLPTTVRSDIDIDALIEKRKETYFTDFRAIWVGTANNLPNLELANVPNLRVICNKPCEKKNVINIAWSRDVAERELLEAHVGLMPLKDEPYNYGKGAFKIIQYMSVGLPVMASSVGYNGSVINPDFALIDDFDTEKLSNDIDKWERMSRASYDEYLKRFSFETNDGIWQKLTDNTSKEEI